MRRGPVIDPGPPVSEEVECCCCHVREWRWEAWVSVFEKAVGTRREAPGPTPLAHSEHAHPRQKGHDAPALFFQVGIIRDKSL
jgi:hypothetical protein